MESEKKLKKLAKKPNKERQVKRLKIIYKNQINKKNKTQTPIE
jgi:hypothetical protein